MIEVAFTVPGAPVGKGRPIAGKSFGSGFTTLRTPTKTVNYESTVALFASQAMAGRPMLLVACEVTLAIRVQVPASWSQKKQRAALAGAVFPTTKPDIDNVEKAIFDGLNGVVWKDDVQVVKVTKSKRYAEQPGVQVTVRALTEVDEAPEHPQATLLPPAHIQQPEAVAVFEDPFA